MERALALVLLLSLIAAVPCGAIQSSVDKYRLSGLTKRPATDPASDPPPASQRRLIAVHDAGVFYIPVCCGGVGDYWRYVVAGIDPETGLPLLSTNFPAGGAHQYVFFGLVSVGGVVGDDTLVSEVLGLTGQNTFQEFWPPDPIAGGVYRTGRYADDEFVAEYTDTVTEYNYVGMSRPYSDTTHIPLGLAVTQVSYSWRDTVYDNFVILDHVVKNIGADFIRDGWIGYDLDGDVWDTADMSPWDPYEGIRDDAAGVLDTQLYDDDPDSRVFIPYIFDNDGDPVNNLSWGPKSVRGVVSLQLLAASIADPVLNCNWWDLYWGAGGFGPRRIGTEDDPFRPFAGGGLGMPVKEEDKYYVLSHPEVDYNQLEIAVHDSSDGWVPCEDPSDGCDTHVLLSFGPFDLAPGDSVTFAVAVVVSDGFHVNPDDYAAYFSLESPYEYQRRLDFTELLTHHRRADSVYRSGYTLPAPGPPVGLTVTAYDDDYVTLAWERSHHPRMRGYFVNVKDTVYSPDWRHANHDPITDTVYTFSILNPRHNYLLAVSVLDTTGRESALSLPISVVPARPHTPLDLTVTLDSLTPELQWQAFSDTALVSYIIDRAVWQAPFATYDSTLLRWYRDEGTESGVKYSYQVSARNEPGLQSPPTDSVSVLPMALDKGVLFYDLNNDRSPYNGPYHRRFVDRLVYAIQPILSMDYYDVEDGDLPFKNMADYSVIIFDSEKRGGSFSPWSLDSIGNYLTYGGRALFIIPNAAASAAGATAPCINRYAEGSFFHDIMQLDSSISNALVISGNFMAGDLTGCLPLTPDYPVLESDTAKLAASPLPVEGGIPISGCLFPRDGTEALYCYQSLYPDSIFHQQINGMKYIGDNYCFVFFNFPLSLMTAPANVDALRMALTHLGVDVTCGDLNANNRFDVGDVVVLLNFLYRGGPAPETHRADVNCDSQPNVQDALVMINVIFRGGFGLACCEYE